jgi:hypothetical protein
MPNSVDEAKTGGLRDGLNLLWVVPVGLTNIMKLEMRKKLAREPFEEKIRKVGQLIRLVKTFPRHPSRPKPVRSPSR